MKLVISTLLATVVSTAALAGNSDRYNDLRLDTAVGHVDKVKVTQPRNAPAVTVSSRNKKGKGYAYINPYGVGPFNDSR